MTTVLLPEQETQVSQGSGGRYCEGCPRCQDANAGFCTMAHPEFGNRHPVCKRCGHCVLRGSHDDDTSDLDKYRGQFVPMDFGRN